jgi:hypothetical protein
MAIILIYLIGFTISFILSYFIEEWDIMDAWLVSALWPLFLIWVVLNGK